MVLGILAEGESYGYAILRRINELSGGELDWTEGLLYPLLHRLERLGYVESSWQSVTGERRRKYYRTTDKGLAELAEQRRQWDTVVGALMEVWLGLGAARRPLDGDPAGAAGMTVGEGQEALEAQFAQWRLYVQRRRELQPSDADELEDHLRGSIDGLLAVGLSADEAFLVAVKRMGSLDELSREFAREHSERLWKQLVLTGGTAGPAADTRSRRALWVMVVCAAGAAASVKAPELFGIRFAEGSGAFYGPNLSLFALPWLAGFLAWRRQARRLLVGILVALFALGAVAANAYPLTETSQSAVITSIHLPIALWLVVGLAYAADDWRSSRRRMDFIRFSGEWFVYYVLIALGGGVLTAFMHGTFEAIGIDPKTFIWKWLLPRGAPAPPGLFDRLQLALVVSALAIDVLVLLEITGRITGYGTTPNKAAALGENVVLLANLAWSAWLLLRFVGRRTPFSALERWQTGYLPVYAVWAWIVVLVFPPLFSSVCPGGPRTHRRIQEWALMVRESGCSTTDRYLLS